MKVLHLSSEESWRGGEQQIVYLVEESIKLGVDAVIGLREGSVIETYCQENNLPYFSLPFKSAYDFPSARKVLNYCSQNKIDLIQTHSSKSHTLAVIAGLVGSNIPQILTRRVDFPVKDNWFSKFKYNYSKISKIICVSNVIKEMTARDIKAKDKLVTIHDGVDLNKFDEFIGSDWLRATYRIPKDVTVIGNTSAISYQKDYETFVKTAELILHHQDKVHFFIVGDGPQREEIEDLIQSKKLEEKITMTGFLPNIKEVLPSLDIFLFTSQTEGLGTTLLDAMAARIPIVATAAGGVREIITNDENGLLYPVKDHEGLSRALMRLMDNPDLGKELIRKGLERVKTYSKEDTAYQTVELYKEVLNKNAAQL